MLVKLITFLAIFSIATSLEDDEFWPSNVEEEYYPLEFMRRITEVTFQLPKIRFINCTSGEPVEDIYYLDSSVVWKFRHDLYDVYDKHMRTCRTKEFYPQLDLCLQCLRIQRSQMIKDIDILFNIVSEIFKNVVIVNKKICDDLTNGYLI